MVDVTNRHFDAAERLVLRPFHIVSPRATGSQRTPPIPAVHWQHMIAESRLQKFDVAGVRSVGTSKRGIKCDVLTVGGLGLNQLVWDVNTLLQSDPVDAFGFLIAKEIVFSDRNSVLEIVHTFNGQVWPGSVGYNGGRGAGGVSYPGQASRCDSGRHGGAGSPGQSGGAGKSMPDLGVFYILTEKISGPWGSGAPPSAKVQIKLPGLIGGDGGTGGPGGVGGRGEKGGNAKKHNAVECRCHGKRGGDGGNAGQGGRGGNGGNGGGGANVYLGCSIPAQRIYLTSIPVAVLGGTPGTPGAPGPIGIPGGFGPSGNGTGPCKGGNHGLSGALPKPRDLGPGSKGGQGPEGKQALNDAVPISSLFP